MKVSTILTNAEIEKIIAADYMDVSIQEEYTPSFMDSIYGIEEELDYACELFDDEISFENKVIKLPARVIVDLDEELLTA